MTHGRVMTMLVLLAAWTAAHAQEALLVREPLTQGVLTAGLEVWDGELLPTPQGLRPAVDRNCLAAPTATSDLRSCRVTAEITPLARQHENGWPLAGLAIYRDTSNFWVLHLVHGPTGQQYFELLERYSATHQAQVEPGTALQPLAGAIRNDWAYGHTYRLTLALSADAISAEATDLATGALVFRMGYALPPEATALRQGTPALTWSGLDATMRGLEVWGPAQDAPAPWLKQADRRRVALLAQGAPPAFMEALQAALRERGYEPVIRAESDLGRLAEGVVVLPWAPAFGLDRSDALLRYLRRGGLMLAVGGTLSTGALEEAREAERRREEALASTPPTGTALDLAAVGAAAFWHASSGTEGPSNLAVADPGDGGGAVLHAAFDHFRSWDNWASRVEPLPEADMLLLFRARSGPDTSHMMLELDETDGSRWIAAIPLSTEWRSYAVPPRKFVYWADNPSKGRGGASDQVKLDHLDRITIGLAPIGCTVSEGAHEFWLGDVRYAPTPADLVPLNWTPPNIEMLSPDYKTYRLPRVADLRVPAAQAGLVDAPAGLPPLEVLSPIARSQGAGFPASIQRRWTPLVEGRGAGGGEATLAALYAPQGGRLRHARWGVVGVADPAALAASAQPLATLCVQMVDRLTAPVRLLRGGLNQVCLVAESDGSLSGFGRPPLLGAEVANAATTDAACTLRVQVLSATDEVLAQSTQPLSVPAEGAATWSLSGDETAAWRLPVEPGQYVAQVELLVAGRLVDRLRQPFTVIAPPEASRQPLVQARDGQFTLDGRRWYAHGLNFWPRYVSGTDPDEYWGHWLTPAYYEPAEIEEDLTIAQSLGMNVLGINYGAPEQAAPLNDFLARCGRHGIRVYLSVGGMHPFNSAAQWQSACDLIKLARLPTNPAVFAYDIAWEPHWGSYADRTTHRAAWERWVLQQYSTLPAAEAEWGFAVPRTAEGAVDVPSDAQIRGDGDWTRMACAYSRFLDDLLGRRWMEECAALRAADPNHLLSFRAAGQPSWSAWGSYDMVACGPFVDFVGPEGYGLRPEEAGFTTAYARWAGNGKPVWWAEFGASVGRYPTQESIEAQRSLWEGFQQMMLDSEANGDAGWWFPGGYRVNELSDFGIIAPEGLPRPAALELQRFAPLLQAGAPRSVVERARIDRDAHAANYQAVYENGCAAWVAANARGARLEVLTEATGTTSATCPLTGIGNVPAGGGGPPRYLTSLFEQLEMQVGDGPWQALTDGLELRVPAGQRLSVRARVVNTGEPTWLAGEATGSVVLAAGERGGPAFQVAATAPTPRYARATFGPAQLSEGLDADTEVVFALHCLDRAWFGERIAARLVVQR